MRPARPAHGAPRQGFTVVEISVAAFILVLVFLMGLTFFSGERRGVASLTEDLDINATVETAFDQISRDVRASAEVLAPELIELKDAPPKFQYGKTSSCVLKQVWPDFHATPITAATTIVRYWLDKPEKVGDLPGGESGVTYSLFRKAEAAAPPQGQPLPAPSATAPPGPDKPLLTGIQELTFYRTKNVPNASGPNGTGYFVLHVDMKVCQLKNGASGRVFRGYAAELETMLKLRGCP